MRRLCARVGPPKGTMCAGRYKECAAQYISATRALRFEVRIILPSTAPQDERNASSSICRRGRPHPPRIHPAIRKQERCAADSGSRTSIGKAGQPPECSAHSRHRDAHRAHSLGGSESGVDGRQCASYRSCRSHRARPGLRIMREDSRVDSPRSATSRAMRRDHSSAARR